MNGSLEREICNMPLSDDGIFDVGWEGAESNPDREPGYLLTSNCHAFRG
jgi:hypothetical protein